MFLVNSVCPGSERFGAENHIYDVAFALSKNNYNIYLITSNGSVYRFNEGFELENTYYLKPAWTNWGIENKSKWSEILKIESPDLIHIFNPSGIGLAPLIVAKEFDIPYIVTIVDYWWQCPDSVLINKKNRFCEGDKSYFECSQCILSRKDVPSFFKSSLLSIISVATVALINGSTNSLAQWSDRYFLIKRILSNAFDIIFLSKTAKESYEKKYTLTNTKYIQTPSKFSFRENKNSNLIRLSERKVKVGFVGSIVEHKGVHVLVEAMKCIPFDYSLNFAGTFHNEQYKARILRTCESLKEVNFAGFLNEASLEKFYLENDLIVIPSICPENQPQVALECLSLEIPLLASNIPGISELVHNDDFLFRMGDASDLRRKLLEWEKKRTKYTVDIISKDAFEKKIVGLYSII